MSPKREVNQLMQIVENWTQIEGVILRISESRLAGFVVIEISVEASQEVPGFKSLIRLPKDELLAVNVPSDICRTLGISNGTKITIRVRMAAHREFFADSRHISTKR